MAAIRRFPAAPGRERHAGRLQGEGSCLDADGTRPLADIAKDASWAASIVLPGRAANDRPLRVEAGKSDNSFMRGRTGHGCTSGQMQ